MSTRSVSGRGESASRSSRTEGSGALPRKARKTEPRTTERFAPLDAHHRLLEEYAAPSLVVTEDHTIVHLSPRVGRYLQMSAGEPSRDLNRLILPDLGADLRTALDQSAKQQASVEVKNVPVSLDGIARQVDLVVRPVLRADDPARGLFLVLFTDHAAADDPLRLSNDDFQNLINSTDVATIFLDRSLRVKFTTPRTRDVFNLLPADIGRPLMDITTRLRYEQLEGDLHRVLDALQGLDREVETTTGAGI